MINEINFLLMVVIIWFCVFKQLFSQKNTDTEYWYWILILQYLLDTDTSSVFPTGQRSELYLQCATRIVSKLLNPIGNGSMLDYMWVYWQNCCIIKQGPLSWQLSLAGFFSQISSIVLAFLGNFGIFVKCIWKKLQGAEYLFQTKILALSICNYAGPNYAKR